MVMVSLSYLMGMTRLLMASAERVGVTGLQHPAIIAIRRRPKHEVRHGLGSNGIGCSATADRMYPHRTDAGLKLHGWRKIERLLEYEISIPSGLSVFKKGLNTRLYFEPILDDGKFDRGARTKTRAAVEGPFRRNAKFNDCKGLPFFSQCHSCGQQRSHE